MNDAFQPSTILTVYVFTFCRRVYVKQLIIINNVIVIN